MAQQRSSEYPTVRETLAKMLDTGDFSDVTVIIGPKRVGFNAHKLILGGRSSVFNAMLQSRWADQDVQSGSVTITLENHSEEAFRIFLGFLYTDKLEFKMQDWKTIVEVMGMAHFYDIPPLFSAAAEFSKTCLMRSAEIQVQGSLPMYLAARNLHDELSDLSFGYFIKNIATASQDGKYLNWDAETMRAILNSESLKIREVELFKALLKWGQHESLEFEAFPRSSALPELLKLIRFPSMNLHDFSSIVAPSNTISRRDVSTIFEHFIDPDNNPTDYNTTPRYHNWPIEISELPNCDQGWDKISSGHLDITTAKYDEILPELWFEVSSPIVLRGIGIYALAITEMFSKLTSFATCELIVKSDSKEVVAKGNTTISYLNDADSEAKNLFLSSPYILIPENIYSFCVRCISVDPSPPFPHDYRLFFRRHLRIDPLMESVPLLGNGDRIMGTILHLENPFSEIRTNWIRHLIFSEAPNEKETCVIT